MKKTPILLICGSKKPAPGKKTPSAARELLKVIQEGIREIGGNTKLIDLRDLELPFFDGRFLEEYNNTELAKIYAEIVLSKIIVFSVPAYWGGVSGVLKNLIDLLGGPKYRDKEKQKSPFMDKHVGLLIVGDEVLSAENAYTSMRVILNSLGAWTFPKNVVVGNLNQIKNISNVFTELKEYGKYLQQYADTIV